MTERVIPPVLMISVFHAWARAIQAIPTLVPFRSAASNSRLSGGGLAGLRVRPGVHIRQKIVIREVMLTLQQTFEVGRQFAGTKRRTLLDAHAVFEEECQVCVYDISDGGSALLNTIEPVDPENRGLIEAHIP
jgi:hypothetical protein